MVPLHPVSQIVLFTFIYKQLLLIVDHVILNKQESFVSNANMYSDQEKAKCVMLFCELKSVVSVQRRFRMIYNKDPPHRNNIHRWCKQFTDTGSVKKQTRPGRPPVSNQTVENIRLSCQRSPKKSLPRRSLELGIPVSTIHKILHKRLHFYAYKIQLLQKIKPADKNKRVEFASFVLNQIRENESFLHDVFFSDEATFHMNGCVNRHNVRIWGNQHPHEIFEKERDSPKVNVWCCLSKEQVIGPFFSRTKYQWNCLFRYARELFFSSIGRT